MSKYIKLPVKFIGEEAAKKIAELEELGLEFDEEAYSYDDFLYVNPDHIICFNEDSNGNVNLTLSDSYNHMIFMTFAEFLELIEYDK